MLNITSVPSEPENLSFYGKVLLASKFIIVGCISYSVITEILFFSYSIFEFLPFHPLLAVPLTVFFTVLGIYLIEGKGIDFLTFVVDSILYKRWKDFIFFFALAAAIFCYSISCFISLGGVPTISKTFVDSPTLSDTRVIDSILHAQKVETGKTYSADSALIKSKYNGLLTALNLEYAAKIDQEVQQRKMYERKQIRTGKSYKTAILNINKKIASLKAEREKKKSEYLINEGAELTALLNERKSSSKAILATYNDEKSKVDSINTFLNTSYQNDLQTAKNGFAGGVVISIPLLVICLFIQRTIYKRCGITTQIQLDDYFYRESVFNKFINLWRVRWLSFAHRKLDAAFSKIQLDEHKPELNEIYKRSDLTKYIDPLQISNSQMNYDDTNSAKFEISDDTTTVKKYDDTKGRKPAYDNRIYDTKEVTTIQAKLRRCTHCKNEYEYRHHKQKYCGDECRKLAWEKRNGRKLKLKAKKK